MCDSMKILFTGDSYTYGTGLLDAYLELKQIRRIYCVKSKSEIRYFLEDISLPEK